MTLRPLGWLLVRFPGSRPVEGWIFPAARTLGAEHETNNELSLGYLPQLTCVSVP